MNLAICLYQTTSNFCWERFRIDESRNSRPDTV